MFEDKALADEAVMAVEKQVHSEDVMEMDPDLKKSAAVHVEALPARELH